MTRRYMILGLILLTLQACASTDVLSRQMSGWQQQPVDVAITEWGEPEQRLTVGDQTILVWRDRLGGASDYANGSAAPAVLCERQLAVDNSGTITGWRWRGDSCPDILAAGVQGAFLVANPR